MDQEILKQIDNELYFTEEELDLFYNKVGRHLYSFVDKRFLLLGVVSLDIVSLDNYVKKDLGIENYEDDNKSMSDVIEENYGEKINDMVKKFMERNL